VLKEDRELEEKDEGQKENAGVEVVDEGEDPLVVVHGGEDLLRVDAVEGDEEGGGDTRQGPKEREVHFPVGAHPEPHEDQEEAGDRGEGDEGPEDGQGEEDVEDDGEGAGNVVEGDLDVLEAEVVEGHHAHKYQGEYPYLPSHRPRVPHGGELHEVPSGFSFPTLHLPQLAADVAQARGEEALKPGHEERGGNGEFRVCHQDLVQVHHANGHNPVGGHN